MQTEIGVADRADARTADERWAARLAKGVEQERKTRNGPVERQRSRSIGNAGTSGFAISSEFSMHHLRITVQDARSARG